MPLKVGGADQHELGDTLASADELAQEFGDRIGRIGRILPFLNPWHSPSYKDRLWW